MIENRGQISLEYLLIFSISLIILIAFTLPLLGTSMDATFDVSDSLKTKSDLSKIANSIKQVYGEGQGSKQTVNLNINNPLKIKITSSHVSSKIKLKSGEYKLIKITVKSKFKTTSFNLSKGMNTIVIEWPVGNKYMTIYRK